MNRVRVLWVGRSERGFVADGIAHYQRRLRPLADLRCEAARAAAHSGRDPGRSLAREAEALLARLKPGEWTVLLDARGVALDTAAFAGLLRTWHETNGTVTFVVGGAYGIDARLRKRADYVLSLSRMTFPHQLVRVILMEQLYRAYSLRAGHAYHHD